MNNNIQNTDSVYWANLKKGDPGALGYFYDKYVDKLFQAALRMTDNREMAKDALQEVFIELWTYRNTLGDVIHSQSYLVKVMRSIMIKKLKKESLTIHYQGEESLVSSEQSMEDFIISADTDKETKTRLSRALANLTNRQKLVLEMRFYEGLTYEQIAARLSMNYQSVNNLAFRTILRLRSLLHLLLMAGFIAFM